MPQACPIRRVPAHLAGRPQQAGPRDRVGVSRARAAVVTLAPGAVTCGRGISAPAVWPGVRRRVSG